LLFSNIAPNQVELTAHFRLDVVQYEVVLANGTITIANDALNADLFWALRGGGGAFAVVTRTYLKAHPGVAGLNVVAGDITCSTESAFKKLVSDFVDLQVPVRELRHSVSSFHVMAGPPNNH
jgi:FAD/FMN-containing dehydrogenase